MVPNLVVEVLSPSTASRDRGEKKAIYERNGVDEYWMVDVIARRISRLVLAGGRYGAPAVFEHNQRFESVLLAGFGLELAGIFP